MHTILSEKVISTILGDNTLVYVYDIIDSTNNEAKKKLREGLDTNAVFVANEQRGGRGRQGKSFYSPGETGLYMSVVLQSGSVCDSLFITTAAAVLTTQAVKEVTGVQLSIKWVNDLYLNDKKVCGILTEAVRNVNGDLLGIVVGIGINLNTDVFPDEISGIAASVGTDADRNELAAKIAQKLFSADISNKKEYYLAEYKKHSMVIGKDVVYYVNNKPFTGRAVDINENGGLVVKTGDELTVLDSGEISLRLE